MGRSYADRIAEAKTLAELAAVGADSGASGIASIAESRIRRLLDPIGRKRRKPSAKKSRKPAKKRTTRRLAMP